MKIVGIVLALALAIAPGVAAAAFTAGPVVTNYRVSQVTPYVYDTTTASVSDAVDLSACGGGVTATFEQSVSDASTDAKVELRACANASDTWPACSSVRVGPSDLPDGVAVAIGNYPAAKPYALARFVTAPTGGDTARVTLACTVETTSVGVTPDNYSVTPSKIGNGDFGPFQCAAGASPPCIQDTGSVGSTQITDVSIVDADVSGSAAIAATKLANTPAGGVAATTVQAAINELDTDKLAIADAIPGWPFYRYFIFNGDPDSVGPIEDATTMCLSSISNTPGTCFANTDGRFYTIFKTATMTGYVHRLTCALDAISGAEANDVLTVQLIEDTMNSSTPTTIGSALTFTYGTDLANNTVKTVVINTALNATTDNGVAVRVSFDDFDNAGEVASLAFMCVVTGYLE